MRLLQEADRYIDKKLPHIYGVPIVKNGYLVFEKYRGSYNSNTRFHLASVSKSIVSYLIGIALKQGFLTSLEQGIIFDIMAVDFLKEKSTVTIGGFQRLVDIRVILQKDLADSLLNLPKNKVMNLPKNRIMNLPKSKKSQLF